ncbi:hypothetical protein GCM10017752_12730 [Streptomyces roseoviridis]
MIWAKKCLDLTVKTTKPTQERGRLRRPAPTRVVERSPVWVMHARRHARDYERLIQHSESLITWAAITLPAHAGP